MDYLQLNKLKEEIIKYLYNIKYDNCFCLQLFHIFKTSKFIFCTYKNTIIFGKTPIFELEVLINENFIKDKNYTLEEKVMIILNSFIKNLIDKHLLEKFNELKLVNIKNNYIINYEYSNRYDIQCIYSVEQNKHMFFIENFYIENSLSYIQYINVNNIIMLPTTFFGFRRFDPQKLKYIKDFKVIKKDIYTTNDFEIFCLLNFCCCKNNSISKFENILSQYLKLILNNIKLDSDCVIMFYNYYEYFLKESYIKDISKKFNKQAIVDFLNETRNMDNDMSKFKYINNNIKKEILLRDDISFQDKIKLSNYM